MFNHDVFDTLETEKSNQQQVTQQSTNIQPNTLVKAMVSSEPCLFSNQTTVAIEPRVVDPIFYYRIARLYEIARWHASLQIAFDKELLLDI